MSSITLLNKSEQKMSTREIAQFTQKEHKNVFRDVKKLFLDLEIDALNFEHIYLDSINREQTEYLLDRDTTDCLLTGYSPKARMAVIKRWRELEGQPSNVIILPNFYDPAEGARAWAAEHDKNKVLAIENQKQSDKIDRLENYFQSGMTITAFSKTLNGVNCNHMSTYCHEKLNWIYNESRSGRNYRWRVRSIARDRFMTETHRSIGQHGADAFMKHEPKLLKEGAQKLYDLYFDEKLPMKKTWNGEFVHYKFEGEAA